jgi:hypothetical protein
MKNIYSELLKRDTQFRNILLCVSQYIYTEFSVNIQLNHVPNSIFTEFPSPFLSVMPSTIFTVNEEFSEKVVQNWFLK